MTSQTSNPPTPKATMRAWGINGYGQPMELMDLPIPTPGPSDVLIAMQGAEVGDWDELVRLGKWQVEGAFPLALGLAGSGIVVAVGVDVRGYAEGDSVYACNYPLYENGAWAEYMLVPLPFVAAPPAGLDLKRAGALPIAALTAHETLVDLLQVQRNDVVLITAAAGGVGHLAVQIARYLGARVIGTASLRNHDFVRALGAETVIDYTTEDVVNAIRAKYPGGVDKALNGVSGEHANELVDAMRIGGHIVDLPRAISVKRPGVEVDSDFMVHGDGARLRLLSRMIDDLPIRVEIHDIVPFDRAPDALNEVLGKHVRGKVALGII
ncbi:MAG: NADP-dependent oxidoreductase [Burkholderia sp.]|nr:NADP-dependent oxidoreductase [Burkholderia sp.]